MQRFQPTEILKRQKQEFESLSLNKVIKETERAMY